MAKSLIQYSRNIYGYNHISLWLMNNEGEGCFELGTGIGLNRHIALLHLIKDLYRLGYLKYIFCVKKSVHHDKHYQGPVQHFRIEKDASGTTKVYLREPRLFNIFRRKHNWVEDPELSGLLEQDILGKILNDAMHEGYDFRVHH